MFTDWLIVIHDYWVLLDKKTRHFDITIPAFLALILVLLCGFFDLTNICVKHLGELLLNVFAILIGFLISGIAMFSGSNFKNADNKYSASQQIKNLTYRQYLLIQMVYCLFLSISILLIVILNMLLIKIVSCAWIWHLALFLYIYETLHMFLLLIRAITWLYAFCFTEKQNDS